MNTGKNNLYLLEVMVKEVEIDVDVLLKSFTFDPSTISSIPLVVKAKFSNFYQMPIEAVGTIESGLGSSRSRSTAQTKVSLEDAIKFDGHESPSGKSCMFPMNASKLVEELNKSPIYLDVFTPPQEGITPAFLGKTKYHFGNNFSEVVNNSLQCTQFPISAYACKTLLLFNMFDDVSGVLELYVRLSCFGPALVSDFNYLSENNKNRSRDDVNIDLSHSVSSFAHK